MNFQFTHPYYLLAAVPALAWVIWFAWKTDVQVSAWRRWCALSVRVIVVLALILAVFGTADFSSIDRAEAKSALRDKPLTHHPRHNPASDRTAAEVDD